MYTSVFSKTLLDRWRGVTIGVVSLAAMLFFGMMVYQDLDVSIYTDLGPAFQALIGIGEDADAASLAYNAIYSTYGAIILAGLAIAMGSALIAGEERRGTIGILLANPRSRTRVTVAKTGAMLLLIGVAGLVLWAAGAATPAILGVSVAGMDVAAFTVHLVVGTLFYGFLALAIGGWSGRPGLAAGVSAGVLTVSFLAVGILEVIDGVQEWAQLSPWYYFSGSDPLLNGVHWGHLALLGGASAALFAVALVGVNRRDLRGRSTGISLLDRLRTNPVTARVGERLAGSARVSRISVKTASEHQGMLFVVSAFILAMGLMMGVVYAAIEPRVADLGDALPSELLALFGGGDMSTPEGFYQIEVFGLVTPIALMVATISVAARALAGEEESRTIGLLLANPVSRSRVLAEKAITMVAFGVVVGVVTFAGVAAGVLLAGVELSISGLAATCALATLIGLLFGALSLLVGAATGRVGLAISVPVAAALVLHTMNALASLNDSWWGVLTPFHYYLGSDPLATGWSLLNAAVLAVATLALIAVAFPAFGRRDLRQH